MVLTLQDPYYRPFASAQDACCPCQPSACNAWSAALASATASAMPAECLQNEFALLTGSPQRPVPFKWYQLNGTNVAQRFMFFFQTDPAARSSSVCSATRLLQEDIGSSTGVLSADVGNSFSQ